MKTVLYGYPKTIGVKDSPRQFDILIDKLKNTLTLIPSKEIFDWVNQACGCVRCLLINCDCLLTNQLTRIRLHLSIQIKLFSLLCRIVKNASHLVLWCYKEIQGLPLYFTKFSFLPRSPTLNKPYRNCLPLARSTFHGSIACNQAGFLIDVIILGSNPNH